MTMVTDIRRPLFADTKLAKSVLASLISDLTLTSMRVRAIKENLSYIAVNPVKNGYVTKPQFYPYTGFM